MDALKESERGSRSRRLPAVERRAEILRAARDLVARHGAHALTMRRVAAAVGIRLASLQHHFATKDSLVTALVEDTAESYRLQFEAALRVAGPTPEARFQAIVGHLLRDLHKEETSRFFFEMWALASRDRHAASTMRGLYAQYRQAMARLIHELNPQLPEPELARRAAAVVALVEGSMLLIPPGGTPATLLQEQTVGEAAYWIASAAQGGAEHELSEPTI